MDGGDGCTILQMYLMPLYCTLNSSKNGNFYIMNILPHEKLK